MEVLRRFARAVRAEPFLSSGLAGILVLAVVIGILSQLAQRAVVASEDRATNQLTAQILRVERVRVLVERRSSEVRTFLLTGSNVSRGAIDRLDDEVGDAIAVLYDGDDIARVDRLVAVYGDYEAAVTAAMDSRDRGADVEELELFAGSEARAKRFELDRAIDEIAVSLQHRQEAAEARRARAASIAATMNVIITAAVFALAGSAVIALLRVMQIERQRQRDAEAHAARMEASNRDLDAFAGRIAHDLRNALNPISFAAASLHAMAGDEAAVRTMATKISRFVQRSGSLIEGLLAFSRASVSTDEGTSDVLRVCRDVADEVAAAAAKGGVDVAIDAEEDSVAMNDALLHQVLANLLGNAVKFLDGRPVRRVRVVGRRMSNDYLIEVADTGPGIPRESLQKIFEPFYRVPGAKAPGTGIGLATVSRILAAHGGSIDVRSRPGAGTTFTVRLKAAEQPAAASAAVS